MICISLVLSCTSVHFIGWVKFHLVRDRKIERDIYQQKFYLLVIANQYNKLLEKYSDFLILVSFFGMKA